MAPQQCAMCCRLYIRYKAIAPFGQMPLLRDPDLDSDSGEDVYLAQSSSIVRYLAAKHDLDDMGVRALSAARCWVCGLLLG
eukprot:SAG31_NODE_1159_length_9603_cov_8.927715_7_plen_81_part_00